MMPIKMDRRTISVTKTFTFDSAHQLRDLHGSPCQNPHGHTYKLEVTVEAKDIQGLILDEKPVKMVIDFSTLKTFIKKDIDHFLDHKDLNSSLNNWNPTAETICLFLWDRWEEVLDSKNMFLKEIRLWETPTSYCTLRWEP